MKTFSGFILLFGSLYFILACFLNLIIIFHLFVIKLSGFDFLFVLIICMFYLNFSLI